MKNKTYTPDEYSAIVDKIIATKKPIDEQFVDLLEAVGNCKVINCKGKLTSSTPSAVNRRGKLDSSKNDKTRQKETN